MKLYLSANQINFENKIINKCNLEIVKDTSLNNKFSENIFNSFCGFINNFIKTDQDLINTLINKFEHTKISRKALLLESGKTADKIFFLHEGFVRFYHVKEDGIEVTSDFYFAPGFITSFTSLIEQKPSIVNVQAMVKMEVLFIKVNW